MIQRHDEQQIALDAMMVDAMCPAGMYFSHGRIPGDSSVR